MDVGILTFQAWWLLYLPFGLPIKSYHFAYKMIYGLHKISHKKKKTTTSLYGIYSLLFGWIEEAACFL